MTAEDFIELILRRYERSMQLFPAFTTHHEAKAVIEEELDEYWDLVKMVKPNFVPKGEMREELIDIAAMALKALVSLCK